MRLKMKQKSNYLYFIIHICFISLMFC